MKASSYLLIFFATLTCGALTFHGCRPPEITKCNCSENKKTPSFCGTIRDESGKPIVGALVEIGTETFETNKIGMFLIKPKRSERYVMNVTRLGYGFVSKIYNASMCDIEVAMSTATVVEIEPEVVEQPEEVIVIEDTTPPPPTSEPLSANISTVHHPLDTLPFVYDARGKLIAFKFPSPVAETYDAAEEFEVPQEGAMIEVAANALVEEGAPSTAGILQSGKSKGKIVGSISTVDIYSPDGMPGDYTIRYPDNRRGYMETFGAADINFYRDGKPLQLKKGQYATLTIPVDTLALMYYGKKLRRTIPLFVYDKTAGEWVRDRDRWNDGKENVGVLNEDGTAYVAKISHFSVYNMDEEFTNPSCTRLCNSTAAPDNIPTTYQIEVAVPPHINRFGFSAGCPGGCPTGACGPTSGMNIHAIARMKPNQPIGLRIFDDSDVVRSTYVFFGGSPSPGTDVYYASCGDTAPYCACPTEVIISRTDCGVGAAAPAMDGPLLAVQRDGTTDNFRFSWVYIDPGATIVPGAGTTPASITNPASIEYVLQYSAPTNMSQDLDLSAAAWTTIPIGASGSATDWKVEANIAIAGVSTSAVVFFRVAVRTGGTGSYKISTVVIINEDDPTYAGSGLYQSYYPVSCHFLGTAIDI